MMAVHISKSLERIQGICAEISGMTVEQSEADWTAHRKALVDEDHAELKYIHSCFGVGSMASLLRKSWRVTKPEDWKIDKTKSGGKDDISLFIRRYGFHEGPNDEDNDWVVTWVPPHPSRRNGKKGDGTAKEIKRQAAYVLNPLKWGPLIGGVPEQIEAPF